MSIYSLHSDALGVTLGYLDASDTVRLLLTGDKTLRSRLKPAFRDFVFRLASPTSLKLSSLLKIFNDSSTNPLRFCISPELYYYFVPFVTEEYTAEKWKRIFPPNLESLEFACEDPFTSLVTCLATLAPQLKTLRVDSISQSITFPQTSLTWLEMGFAEAHASLGKLDTPLLLEKLPTTLTHLKFHQPIFVGGEIDVSKLPFRKMPLAVFQGHFTFRNLIEEHASWDILPKTITDLKTELYYGEKTFFPRPASWKRQFPNLTSLNVPMELLAKKKLLIDSQSRSARKLSEKQISEIRASFPESLTALQSSFYESEREYIGLPLIICALGDRLTSYDNIFSEFQLFEHCISDMILITF